MIIHRKGKHKNKPCLLSIYYYEFKQILKGLIETIKAVEKRLIFYPDKICEVLNFDHGN